jgi:hypothetical protein
MRAVQIAEPDVRVEVGRARRRAGDVVLVVDGTFDLPSAMRAATAARAQAGRARVKLDLCRARVEDVALAAFVRDVAGWPVAILGLSRHHERLLRYLEEGAGAEECA